MSKGKENKEIMEIVSIICERGVQIDTINKEMLEELIASGKMDKVLSKKGISVLSQIIEDEDSTFEEDLGVILNILKTNPKEDGTDKARAKIDENEVEEKPATSQEKPKAKKTRQSLVETTKLSDKANKSVETALKALQEVKTTEIVSVCVAKNNTTNPKKGVINTNNLKVYKEDLSDIDSLIEAISNLGEIEFTTDEKGNRTYTKGEDKVKAIQQAADFIASYKEGSQVDIVAPKEEYSQVIGIKYKGGDNSEHYVKQDGYGTVALSCGGNIVGKGPTSGAGISIKAVELENSDKAGEEPKVVITVNRKLKPFVDNGNVEVINKDVDKKVAKERFGKETKSQAFNTQYAYWTVVERKQKDGSKKQVVAKKIIKCTAEVNFKERASDVIEKVFGKVTVMGELKRFDLHSEEGKNVVVAIIRNTDESELPAELRNIKKELEKEISGGEGKSTAGSVDSAELE